MYLLFVAHLSTNLLQHLLYVTLMVLLPYYLNYLLYASLHIQNHKMAISYISHFTFISSFITSENIHIVAYSTCNNVYHILTREPIFCTEYPFDGSIVSIPNILLNIYIRIINIYLTLGQ